MNDATSPSAAGQTPDPVCGMIVDPTTAKSRLQHEGRTYYFCCGGCKARFLADPAQFVNPTAKPIPAYRVVRGRCLRGRRGQIQPKAKYFQGALLKINFRATLKSHPLI